MSAEASDDERGNYKARDNDNEHDSSPVGWRPSLGKYSVVVYNDHLGALSDSTVRVESAYRQMYAVLLGSCCPSYGL
jgi:hypothetical protein